MHAVGIHSAMAIKRQRKRRDEQKRARERRYSTQSSESGGTLHSPMGSFRRKYHAKEHATKKGPGNLDSQVVTSIGMLHIGIVFIVFGLFLCGAGIIPDEPMSWNVFSAKSVWWNEVTCTGLFSLGLGLFLLILNCLISRKEEEDLEDYVQHQLTRSRSGHRLERDLETGVLTTRHTRKAVALQRNDFGTDVSLVDDPNTDIVPNGSIRGLNSPGDILLEKIIEEDISYRNERNSGVSPIEIENDTKKLLRSDSTTETINIKRI